jgi:8-oxo-dGTP diphosphatase
MNSLDVAVGIIFNELGQVLITQRSTSGPYPSLWEFPGGKLDKDETPLSALTRELKEELGIECINILSWLNCEHQYPDLHVRLHVFLIKKYYGKAKCLESQQAMVWASKENLNNYQFPAGNVFIIDKLQKMPNSFFIAD